MRSLEQKYNLMDIDPDSPLYPFLSDYRNDTVTLIGNILKLFFIGDGPDRNLKTTTMNSREKIQSLLKDIDKTPNRPTKNSNYYFNYFFGNMSNQPKLLILNYKFLIYLNYLYYDIFQKNYSIENNSSKSRSENRTISRHYEGEYTSEKISRKLFEFIKYLSRSNATISYPNTSTPEKEINTDELREKTDKIKVLINGKYNNANERNNLERKQKKFIQRFFEDIIQTVYYQAMYDKRQKQKAMIYKSSTVLPSLILLENIFNKLFEKKQDGNYVYDEFNFLENIFNDTIKR